MVFFVADPRRIIATRRGKSGKRIGTVREGMIENEWTIETGTVIEGMAKETEIGRGIENGNVTGIAIGGTETTNGTGIEITIDGGDRKVGV